MFKSFNELANADLSIDQKIRNVPILVVGKNNHDLQNIAAYFKKQNFIHVLTANNTEEILQVIQSGAIKDLLRICIINPDLEEKYFILEDFKTLEEFEAEAFWKNCIQDNIMTIIGKLGVPVSYEKFIRNIKKFGTVDSDLAENMDHINDKAKILDAVYLFDVLKSQKLVDKLDYYYVLDNQDDEHYNKLNNELLQKTQNKCFKTPVDVSILYSRIERYCRDIIEHYYQPDDQPVHETLSPEKKRAVQTTSQQINHLIDLRVQKIKVKYSDKLDFQEIENVKKKIYEIMFHYAVKNELQYFQFFVRGLKGIFTILEKELNFNDIRQCFLFKNIIKEILQLDYQIIKPEIRKSGVILLLIINNFLFQQKNGYDPVPRFDPMTFYRALGIIFLWPRTYFKNFLSILNKHPGYIDFFMAKENRDKRLSPQNYQAIHHRILSFTDKVFQVDQCINQ